MEKHRLVKQAPLSSSTDDIALQDYPGYLTSADVDEDYRSIAYLAVCHRSRRPEQRIQHNDGSSDGSNTHSSHIDTGTAALEHEHSGEAQRPCRASDERSKSFSLSKLRLPLGSRHHRIKRSQSLKINRKFAEMQVCLCI